MSYANASHTVYDVAGPTTPPDSATDQPSLSAGGKAAAQRILKKYAPLFEQARQSYQAHLQAHDYPAVVREVTWMAKLDDALINDLCLMTDQSPEQAQPYRQIRRSDIEILRIAAWRSGNTPASLRAEQLLRNVREISLHALSELRKTKRSDDLDDERFRDYGCVVSDVDTIGDASTPPVMERRKR